MARKRSPGAKYKGPTPRKTGFSSSPLNRIMNSWVIAYCSEDHFTEVPAALQGFFDNMTECYPPLPENYSFGAMGFGEDSEGVPITCYGLQEGHMDMAMSWLERHPKATEWNLWVPDAPERTFPGA